MFTEEEKKAMLDTVKEQNKEQLDSFKAEIKQLSDDSQKGIMTKEEAEKRFNDISEKLQKVDVESVKNELSELKDSLKIQGEAIKSIKEVPAVENKKNKFEEDVKTWVDSSEFKSWVDGNMKGTSPELSLKYSLTGGNRTGTTLITEQSTKVSDSFVARKLHIRDLMNVIATDMPNHTFDRITAWTPGADMVTENGDAPTFDVTTAEQTVNVKRVAGIMDISNNAFRSLSYLKAKITTTAPEKLRNVEDFQLLFGDGAGNNINGIYRQATTFDLTGPSFSAGAVASVASYDGGAKILVTFGAVHGLTNANKITFASATHTGYNATFQVNVKTDKSIVLDKSYTAEADTSAWTATSVHYLKNAIDGAQEYDVLMAAKAYMSNSEYVLTAFVLNPATAALIESLKSTQLEYVGKIERLGGVLNIGGVPVIENNSLPTGKFLGGDFYAAAELLEYQGMSLRFVEDVSYVKANKQALYITEQIMLPVYNPFMFVKGDFATAKTALETA